MVQQVAAAAVLTSCRMAMLVGPPRLGIQKKPLVSRPSSAAFVRALHTQHNNRHRHLSAAAAPSNDLICVAGNRALPKHWPSTRHINSASST